MLNALKREILEKVWSPFSHNAYHITTPHRLTPRFGERGSFNQPPFNDRSMPNNDDVFVVYQVGYMSSNFWGLKEPTSQWQPLVDLLQETPNVFQFFVGQRYISSSDFYVKRVEEGGLLFALKIDKYRTWINDRDKAIFKSYVNDIYNDPNDSFNPPVWASITFTDIQSLAIITNAMTNYESKKILMYHNGVLIKQVIPSTFMVGDYLSYIVDDTIIHEFEYSLDNTFSYLSAVNSNSYYVVQNELTDGTYYFEDLEVYLMGTQELNSVQQEVGVYAGLLNENDLVQLTNCDFGIRVGYIDNIISSHPEINFNDLKLNIRVRKNRNKSIAPNDSSFLKHLYQVDKNVRKNLLSGNTISFPSWNAINLEQSNYLKVARMSGGEIRTLMASDDINDFVNIFNYFGILDVFQKNDIDADGNYLYSASDTDYCTKIDFTQGGALNEITNIANAIPKTIIGQDKVITISGIGNDTLDSIEYNQNNLLNDIDTDFEVNRYVKENIADEWILAEEGTHFDFNSVKEVVWRTPYNGWYKADRNSGFHYVKTDMVLGPASNIVLEYELQVKNDIHWPLTNYVGHYIWLNKQFLVQGIDYQLYDNKLILKNKQYVSETSNVLDIIFYGPNVTETLEYEKSSIGWIKHGEVSRNNYYDFYLDTHSDIFVGGRYIEAKEVKMAENGNGTMPAWVKDGMPYAIVPRKHVISDKFVQGLSTGRQAAYQKLEQAETLLDSVISEPINTNPIVINGKHDLVSPLIDKIVRDLKASIFLLERNYTDYQLIAAVRNKYQAYIDMEIQPTAEDEQYIGYYPIAGTSTIELTAGEYNFISRVNQLLLNNRVRIETGLTIGS